MSAIIWDIRITAGILAFQANGIGAAPIYPSRLFGALAQSVERETVNFDVIGSSPICPATNKII